MPPSWQFDDFASTRKNWNLWKVFNQLQDVAKSMFNFEFTPILEW